MSDKPTRVDVLALIESTRSHDGTTQKVSLNQLVKNILPTAALAIDFIVRNNIVI